MMTPGKSNVETKGVQGGISRHYEFLELILSTNLVYVWLKYQGVHDAVEIKQKQVKGCFVFQAIYL